MPSVLPDDISQPSTTLSNDAEPAILPPELDDGHLEIGERSIRTVQQAVSICESSEANNKSRAYRAYVIQQVNDGAAPNSFAAQLQRGKSWQNNFSTNWLAGLCQPLRMRLQDAVIKATTLTYSTIPDTAESYSSKTDVLQQAQSNILRNWSDFSDFLSAVSGDVALQGMGYGVFLDPWTPFPTFFKLEDGRVPERSKMNPKELQWFTADWDYPVQDFILLFKDEEAAEAAGYDIENCNEAAHKATVEAEAGNALTTKPRRFAEMITEGALGMSFAGGGQRIVKTWMFWNVEYDKKVSFWLIDRDSKKLLRFAYKAFKSMEDVLQIFSFEGGNSCIHSSKGIGRVLINQALAIEKNRNRMFDSMAMASTLILKAGVAARNKLDITVNAPFVLIDENATVETQKFEANYDGYIGIDRFLTSAAQQAAGVWINDIINPTTGQSDMTATEAKIQNARGQESAVMFISRFMDKWHGLCGVSQRRAWSDDNLETALDLYKEILADPSADRQSLYEDHANADAGVLREIVAAYKKWPGGVDPTDEDATDMMLDEIAVWRDSPATLRAHILDARYDAGVGQIYVENMKAPNPGIDQVALLKLRTQQVAGEQYADKILIPSPNQTVVAEASRQQLGENADMQILQQQIPVSPRDNWQAHGTVTVQALQRLTANPPPEQTKYAELLADHLGQHLQQAMQAGQSGNETFKQMDEFYKGYTNDIKKVVVMRAHANAAQQALIAHHSPGGPGAGMVPGAPPQGQGQPQIGPVGKGGGMPDLKEYINVDFSKLPLDSQQAFLQSIGLPPSALLDKAIKEAMQVPSKPVLDAAQTQAEIQQGHTQNALQAQGQQTDAAQQTAQLQLQAQAQAQQAAQAAQAPTGDASQAQ